MAERDVWPAAIGEAAMIGSRALIGLAVQPLVATLIGLLTFPVVDYTGRPLYGGRPGDPLDAAIAFGLAIGVAAIPVTLFGALPALAWLARRGPVTLRHALLAGALLGNAPGALIVTALAVARIRDGASVDLAVLTYGRLGAVRAIALGTFIGTVCAAIFWSLAGRAIAAAGGRHGLAS